MLRIVQSPVKHKRHSFSLFSPGDFFIHLEANFSVWWWGDKAPFKCLLHTASGSSSFYGLSMLRNDCDDKRKMLLVAGLEGTAAAQASDFAFTKFHFLRRALLVHGHWFVVVIVVIILVIIKPGIMFESVFWSSIPFTRTLPASLARCCHHLWHKSDPRSFISRCFTCSTPTSALRYFLAWSLWKLLTFDVADPFWEHLPCFIQHHLHINTRFAIFQRTQTCLWIPFENVFDSKAYCYY